MGFQGSRSVRFEEDVEIGSDGEKYSNSSVHPVLITKHKYGIDDQDEDEVEEGGSKKRRVSYNYNLKKRVLSRVFSEDYEKVKKKILDPRGESIRRWSKIFLVSCLLSLFVDPFFFFLPCVGGNNATCIHIGISLELFLTLVRTLADVFYVLHIYVKFRTAYVAPSSRVFGRGELVVDPRKIAARYVSSKDLFLDVIAALPLPQILIWGVIPNLNGSMMMNTKNVLRFILIFQYLPRLFLMFPLSAQIVKATGVVTQTAWAGAAYNLMLFILASHVLGACWYLLSVERQEACWKHYCSLDPSNTCQYQFFDCNRLNQPSRQTWFLSSNITNLCDPNQGNYPFGIYAEALTSNVTSSPFFNKYFYCLWWGLKNLRAY